MSTFEGHVAAAVKDSMRTLPDNFDVRLVAADGLLDAARAEIAEALAPALNAKLKTMPQTNYGEKQAVAKWVNETLRSVGLSIRGQGDEPALLKARAGHNPTETGGEYFLETTDEMGVRHSPRAGKGFTTLPDLKLMPADLSRLSHVEQAIVRNSGGR